MHTIGVLNQDLQDVESSISILVTERRVKEDISSKLILLDALVFVWVLLHHLVDLTICLPL